MAKWICPGCNFRFEAENPSECPYCGRTNIEKDKNASELLKEIEKMLEE